VTVPELVNVAPLVVNCAPTPAIAADREVVGTAAACAAGDATGIAARPVSRDHGAVTAGATAAGWLWYK
jgi:hypothetical protein